MGVTHSTVVVAADDGTSPVGTNEWNAKHVGGDLPFDTLPTSAHAKDDEFGDASGQSGPINGLDAKWTNPLSSGGSLDLALTLANGELKFEPNTSGTSSTGKHLFGIRQSAPTSSFTLMGKVTSLIDMEDDCVSGIYVGTLSNTTAHFVGAYNFNGTNDYRLCRSISINNYSHTADAGAYDGGTFTDISQTFFGPRWGRLVYDAGASTLAFYISGDGSRWNLLMTKTSISQPTFIGIALYSNSGTVKAHHEMGCDWFRVTEP